MPFHRSGDLRRGRASIIGQVYHVTLTTHHRAPHFANFWLARHVVNAMRQSDNDGITETLAYVVMPDHVHWPFALRTGTLSKAVARVKAQITRTAGGDASPWQRDFFDHALRQEEDLTVVARYIVANPLRAGLVARLADYPHWDAVWLGDARASTRLPTDRV